MKYVKPLDEADPNASYSNGNPLGGIKGSIVPATAIEHTQREIVNAIIAAGLVPDEEDLTQLAQVIASVNVGALLIENNLGDLDDLGDAWTNLGLRALAGVGLGTNMSIINNQLIVHGCYLRTIRIYSNQTYNKSADCRSQHWEGWGAGAGAGGAATDGGDTTWTGIVAAGGKKHVGTVPGIGGVSTGGDLNIRGSTGANADTSNFGAPGGMAPRGGPGGGATNAAPHAGGFPGGGAGQNGSSTATSGSGSYVEKWYAVAITGVAVTIGAPGTGTNAGAAGYVEVHEFS